MPMVMYAFMVSNQSVTDPYRTDRNYSLHSWFTSIFYTKITAIPLYTRGYKICHKLSKTSTLYCNLTQYMNDSSESVQSTLVWVQQLCAVTLHFPSPATKSLVALESASAFMFAVPARCSTVYSYGCRAKLHLQSLGFPPLRRSNHSRER